MLDILGKMQEKQKEFDELKVKIEEFNKQIAEIEQNKKQIGDEMLRMQGEYRMLVLLGQEEGIIDENGNPILKPADEE